MKKDITAIDTIGTKQSQEQKMNKRSSGETSRHRQQVKDKGKSDTTEHVPTNSNVNDGAEEKGER